VVALAGWSGSLLRWERELGELKDRLVPVFGRSKVRESAGAFIDGALSGIARKTGWQLAEQAGLDRPYRMQSLLLGLCEPSGPSTDRSSAVSARGLVR
jgi:hypothetical protein